MYINLPTKKLVNENLKISASGGSGKKLKKGKNPSRKKAQEEKNPEEKKTIGNKPNRKKTRGNKPNMK